MCGISGIISKNTTEHHQILQKMNSRIIHRGPDAEGTYLDSNVALGHRRLSILDLSEQGNQPMSKHDFVIVFNGEIYNYIELREELKNLGYSFTSQTDTEVILSSYHCWGSECLKKFNGMWAFLIYNPKAQEIFASRDQFGIKPLYYSENENLIAFASEIKQFLELPGFKPTLNKLVAAKFLINGQLNQQQETFFEGVLELKPGCSLRLNTIDLKFKITKWYDFKLQKNQSTISYEDALKRFINYFQDAVNIRMRADVKVGSCLSGGIDSSSIVCSIQDQGVSVETVTSCYADKRFDEQEFSDIVTLNTRFKAHKIYGDNSMNRREVLRKMIYHQDQPVATGSHFSEYNVFSEAHKRKLIVMLDGQGSDEYLGGYPEFKTVFFSSLLYTFKWNSLNKLVEQEASLYKLSKLEIYKRELKSLFYYPFIAGIKRIQGKKNKEYSKSLALLIDSDIKSPKNFRELSVLELETTSLPYQLHSEDRNSMLFSIESRLPFLDYRLVEFCLSLPDHFKYRDGYTKKILRDAIAKLPQAIKDRKDKMGFVSPDESWVKENANYFLEQMKKAMTEYQFITQEFINQFNLFLVGKRSYETKYFRVISLIIFCEEFKIKTN
jgi:asparagine synthase (glutamine-hydrolysing)